MTKNEELTLLDQTIAKLGPDSYLGPWLQAVRADVEATIRSDFYPAAVPSDAAKALAEAREEALAIRREALAYREQQTERARVEVQALVDTAKSNARRALQRALEAL